MHAKEPYSVAELLGDLILLGAQGAAPRCKPSSYSKAWWIDELTALIKEYHALRRTAKKSWLAQDIEDARLCRNHYFRGICVAKKKHWEGFLAGANDKSLFKAFSYSSPNYNQPTLTPR